MPKVSEEYFDQKKRMITDAAYRVCLRKPVEMVTMMDVIEETGLSQGGIYRFYKNLDEILSDMIAGMRSDYNIIDRLEEVTGDPDKGFEEVTYDVCEILANVMDTHLNDIQKINFDLNVLAINEPERAAKIIEGTKGRGNLEYLTRVVMPRMVTACENKQLKPKEDIRDIMNFISAAYAGIEMNCILSACYKNGPMQMRCNPAEMFKVLARTIILLFGGEDN